MKHLNNFLILNMDMNVPHCIKRDLSNFFGQIELAIAHETCIFCDHFDTNFMTIAHCMTEI